MASFASGSNIRRKEVGKTIAATILIVIDELGLALGNYADRAQLRAIAARPEAERWG